MVQINISQETVYPFKYNACVIPEMPLKTYHEHDAIGSSSIKDFLLCPALFKYNKDNRLEESTPSLERGTAAHCMFLEPSKFQEQYVVADPTIRDRRSKGWKDAQAKAKSDGKTAMLSKDFEELRAMHAALMAHGVTRNIITAKDVMIETSFFARHESGLDIKARPDILINNILIDYKTTELELSVREWAKHSYRMGRHIQAYHHARVVHMATLEKVEQVLHIVQQANPPYLIRIFEIGTDWLECGRRDVEYALEEIAHCYEQDSFPGYPEDEIVDLPLPGYAGMEIY